MHQVQSIDTVDHISVNWQRCRQIHLTHHFSHATCTLHYTHITLHGSSVCMRASCHLHVIHDERLIVRSLLLPRFVFLRVSLRGLPLLFLILLVL